MTNDIPIQTRRALQVWTIYDHPKDFPDHYVARANVDGVPTDHYHTFETLADLEVMRNTFRERGMVRVERHHSDDTVIMEVWL